MILCVGEILADFIGTRQGGGYIYECRAGGAPFNVACAIAKLGGAAAFAGSVGDDAIGDFLADYAGSRGLCRLAVERLADRNTTLAFVSLNREGERSFSFYRKNTADSCLREISDGELAEADTVHIGSLMLSVESGFEYAVRLALRARAAGCRVSFDVNYRTDIFRDERTARERAERLIDCADIVKFSEDETKIFGESYIDGLKDKLVCITLGSRGSEWRYGGERRTVPTVKVKPVDTTGAGDAFFAGVLKGTDGVPSRMWTAEFLSGVLTCANVCGALNTLGKGAIDCLPDAAAVEAALKTLPWQNKTGGA